jgi:rhodanese-related sulfurtransferase
MLGKLLQSIMASLKPKYQSLSAKEAKPLVTQKSHLLIDVRSRAEFSGGKIKGSRNIPLNELGSRISELSSHSDKPILVNCLSGSRSRMACSILTKSGFTDVANLSGGVMAWQGAGFKLV